MLSWLMVSWAFTFGYLPCDGSTIVEPSNAIYGQVFHEDAIATKFELSAEAFNHLRISSSIETREVYNGQVSSLGAFSPYEGYFKLGAAFYGKSWEVGISHECDHGIQASNVPSAWLWAGNTELYIKLSGKSSF